MVEGEISFKEEMNGSGCGDLSEAEFLTREGRPGLLRTNHSTIILSSVLRWEERLDTPIHVAPKMTAHPPRKRARRVKTGLSFARYPTSSTSKG